MPTANYVNGTNSSTSVTASAGSLHSCIDDAPGNPASDGDWIYSYDGNCSLSFPSVSDPGNDYNWKLKTRNKHDGSGLDSNSIEFKLYGGGSLIKSWTPSIGTSYTYREIVCSSSEGASIRSNLTNLDLEIYFTPIGGSGATGYVSAFNLEAPDAATVWELATSLSVTVSRTAVLQNVSSMAAAPSIAVAVAAPLAQGIPLASGLAVEVSVVPDLSAVQALASELTASISLDAQTESDIALEFGGLIEMALNGSLATIQALETGLAINITGTALLTLVDAASRNVRQIRVPLKSIVLKTVDLEAIRRVATPSRIIEEREV